MQTTSAKQSYSVWIMRRDGNHICVIETDNFDEADKVNEELINKWVSCLKEQSPFGIRKPLITTFDPGYIYEISLLPFGQTNNSNNPYQQQMRDNGFSSTFNKFKSGSEMLDSGYKY
jgi:hypothetical protein